MSCHTDPPRDMYIEELIKNIKKKTIKKKKNIIKPRSFFKKSPVDVYAGKNGKKARGWYDIDNYFD